MACHFDFVSFNYIPRYSNEGAHRAAKLGLVLYKYYVFLYRRFPNIVGWGHVMMFCTYSFFPNEISPFTKIELLKICTFTINTC